MSTAKKLEWLRAQFDEHRPTSDSTLNEAVERLRALSAAERAFFKNEDAMLFGLALTPAECSELRPLLAATIKAAKDEGVAYLRRTFGAAGNRALVDAGRDDPTLLPVARSSMRRSADVSQAWADLLAALRSPEAHEHWRTCAKQDGGIAFSFRVVGSDQPRTLSKVEETWGSVPSGIEALYAEIDGLSCEWSEGAAGEVAWEGPTAPVIVPLVRAVAWGEGVWLGGWPELGALLWTPEAEAILWKPTRRAAPTVTVAQSVTELLQALTRAFGDLPEVLEACGVHIPKPRSPRRVRGPKRDPNSNRAALLDDASMPERPKPLVLKKTSKDDWLGRYQQGECVQVWSELRALGPEVRAKGHIQECQAVARATMQRVRWNLESLVRRWSKQGYSFGYDWAGEWAASEVRRAPPLLGEGMTKKELDRYERRRGPLPLSLRAFYECVGAVNFVGHPMKGDERWRRQEERDPIQVAPPNLTTDDDDGEEVDEERELVLFPDSLGKYFVSGVGAIGARVDAAADFVLFFEGAPLAFDEPLTFVTYLRKTILERGGFGCLTSGENDADPALVRDLTKDLLAF